MPAFLQTKQYLISKQEMSYVIHYGKFYNKKKTKQNNVLLKGNSTKKVKLE